MVKQFMAYMVLFILLPTLMIGQEKAKPTFNLGVNAIRPTISASINYPVINNIQVQLYSDIGYFEKTFVTSGSSTLHEHFYGVGLIPEVKIYPIKRKADDNGFYISFYSGFWGILKQEDFDNDPENTEIVNKTGLITWQFGIGAGYKLKTYKNWYINPYIGYAPTDVTPNLTVRYDETGGVVSGFNGLRYIPMTLRYELKIGYSFEFK